MAIAIARAAKAGRRHRRRGRAATMAEINVTPMVDVMLVLLIVFMVAAPLLTVGVPIDLPQTQAKSLNTESKPITISVTPNGELFVANERVQLDQLVTRMGQLVGKETDKRIYLRGDASANYGAVMRVMGVLSAAGFAKIGLITEKEQGQ